jgi:hypothetical protein
MRRRGAMAHRCAVRRVCGAPCVRRKKVEAGLPRRSPCFFFFQWLPDARARCSGAPHTLVRGENERGKKNSACLLSRGHRVPLSTHQQHTAQATTMALGRAARAAVVLLGAFFGFPSSKWKPVSEGGVAAGETATQPEFCAPSRVAGAGGWAAWHGRPPPRLHLPGSCLAVRSGGGALWVARPCPGRAGAPWRARAREFSRTPVGARRSL